MPLSVVLNSIQCGLSSHFTVFAIFLLPFVFVMGLTLSLIGSHKVIVIDSMEMLRLSAMGLVSLTFITIPISIYSISEYTLWLSLLACFAVIIHKRDQLSINLDELININQFTFLVVTLITFYIFWKYGSVRTWPPIGDVATVHSPQVERFSYLGHLPLRKNELTILYPPGFHILSSTLNQLFAYYSPQIVYYVAILVTAFIPLMNYLITYNFTKSNMMGLTGFVLSWYVHPSLHHDRYFTGPLTNGTYPYLYGVFIIQTIILLVSRYEVLIDNDYVSFFSYSFIAMFSLFFVYPTFSIVMIIIYLLLILLHYKINLNLFNRILKENKQFLLFCLLLTIISLFIKPEILNIFHYFTAKFAYNGQDTLSIVSPEALAYKVDLRVYASGLLGFISIISMIFGVSSNQIRKSPLFIMFAPVFFIIILSGTVEQLNGALFLLSPNRSTMILKLLGVAVFLFSVHRSTEHFTSPTNMGSIASSIRGQNPERVKTLIYTIVFISCLTLSLPSLDKDISQKFLTLPDSTRDADFDAFIWLGENSTPDDVVLSSPTWVGWYASSFTQAENVHHQYWRLMNQDRERALWQVWLQPENEALVTSLLLEYDVSYLIVTSGRYQFDFAEVWSQRRAPEIYLEYFNSYSFLHPVFAEGNVAVYRVET